MKVEIRWIPSAISSMVGLQWFHAPEAFSPAAVRSIWTERST